MAGTKGDKTVMKGLISRYLYYFGENHVIDSIYYLLPLQKELFIRKYSRRTIKSYIRITRNSLLFSEKKPRKIEKKELNVALYYVVNQKRALNPLKFSYEEALKKEFIFEIKHLKKDKRLPVGLNKKRILNATSNIKHEVILMLMYSGGLVVGEFIKLRVEDINSNRKLIHIRASKGGKASYTFIFVYLPNVGLYPRWSDMNKSAKIRWKNIMRGLKWNQ